MNVIHALGAKLSNFTTTHTTLEPLAGRGDVRPGGFIEFELPSESLVNLPSFALHVDVALEGTLTDGTIVQRIPLGETMIENVEILCGGVRLDGGGGYLGNFKNKRDMLNGVSGDALSKPFMHPGMDPEQGKAVDVVEDETRVCLRRFDGFLSAGVVDMSLLPPVTVRIELTKARVVVTAAELADGMRSAAPAQYTSSNFVVRNPHAVLELIGVGSEYDRLQESIIGSRGYLPINFKIYHSFSSGKDENNVRFDVMSRSIDRIWHMSTNDPNVNGSTYQVYNTVLFYGSYPQALRSLFHSGSTYQIDLAGVQLPQRPADQYELFQQTMNSLPPSDSRDIIRLPPSFSSWRDAYYLSCLRLCAPKEDMRNSSGLDSRGISLSGNLRLTKTPGGYRNIVITESTAELRVKPGREVELVP